MMKLKTWITVLFMTLAAAPGFAEENSPSKDATEKRLVIKRQVKSNIYELIYLTGSRSDLRIIVKDDRGNTLLKKRVKTERSVRIPFNLKLLPYGTYTFIIKDNGQVLKEVVNYWRKATKEKKIKVNLRHEKDPKTFRLVALGAYDQPLEVMILDMDDNLIYRDRIKVDIHNFSRVYDLASVPTGHFKFKVYHNNQLISNTIF